MLSKAPIAEAVIEFRFSPDSSLDFSALKKMGDTITDKFPLKEEKALKEMKWHFSKKEPLPQLKDLGPVMLILSSTEKNRVVQLRTDRYAFSSVGPYSTWNEFSTEAMNVWQRFDIGERINSFSRVGVRYINNLNLPKDRNYLERYLSRPPKIPENVSGGIEGFLNRVIIKNSEIPASSTIALALDHNKISEESLPVILDIDVFYSDFMEYNEGMILDVLEKLRNFKNDIFFNSLTEEGIGLYK
ncbi:MAG: TIGR04255 family protein [Nitrospinota bacterium]